MSALKAHWEITRSLQDGRSARRRKLSLESQGTTSSGIAADVLIHNLSTKGLLIETSAKLSIGEVLGVEVPHAGATLAVVMWNSGDLFGCEFVAPVPNAAISASLLQNPIERLSAVPATEVPLLRQDSGSPDIGAEVDAATDGAAIKSARLPLRTRALIIVGSSLLAWTLIIWVIARSL
ncbi:PilZ domain-containing protein [Novosphingobium sp. G106]|uniref:PilZ domain-containing protein n=1 Tax=Novosphingobium sp. G106 TaxID=2849500 RepID=UPI001C2D58C0|nr:PilZ domain-containing protein [Novosphingobium sp. G106]MBV1689551.1 PilZ domain-containing protein [Novosphingobium sp. G106]